MHRMHRIHSWGHLGVHLGPRGLQLSQDPLKQLAGLGIEGGEYSDV